MSEQRVMHALLDELDACHKQLAHQANIISALADQLYVKPEERDLLGTLRKILDAL